MTGLKQLVKPLARSVLHGLGGLAALRYRNRQAFRILMYHRFPGDAETRRNFEAQCATFRRHYHPVTLTQIAESLESGRPLPPKALAITVDDGYRDFLDVGFPVFQAHNLPVTVFLVSDFLDRKCWLWTDLVDYAVGTSARPSFELAMTPDAAAATFTLKTSGSATVARQIIQAAKKVRNEDRLRLTATLPALLEVELPARLPAHMEPLTWDEVRSLAGQGVEFGAHTKSHPILSRISDPAEQRLEIEHSLLRLREELGADAAHFCYPNGAPEDYNQTSIDCVRAAGFRTAVTTTPGFNFGGAPPFLLKRFGMEPGSPLAFALERAEGLHD